MNRDMLHNQIFDSAGNVLYTYAAHWVIVDRLVKRYKRIKIAQIVLTALSTGGFLTSVMAGVEWLGWVGGLSSSVALGLNLYTLNFNEVETIKKHTEAANELWDIREAYRSLLVDFSGLSDEEIRAKRDELMAAVGKVNKNYPGTDAKSISQAQKDIEKYSFSKGESEKLFNNS